MKRTLLALAVLWLGLILFFPRLVRADDDYAGYIVSAIDTSPTNCSLADGCASFSGVTCVLVTNTGATAFFIGLDKDRSSGLSGWSTTGLTSLAAGAQREICSSKVGAINKVFLKTASGTSSATVEGVR